VYSSVFMGCVQLFRSNSRYSDSVIQLHLCSHSNAVVWPGCKRLWP